MNRSLKSQRRGAAIRRARLAGYTVYRERVPQLESGSPVFRFRLWCDESPLHIVGPTAVAVWDHVVGDE